MRNVAKALTGLLASAITLSLASSGVAQGYRVTEDYRTDAGSADAGPVRMARFGLVQGKVAWRPSPSAEWVAAVDNIPCRQGSQILVSPGGKAELQFDDGSILRLGSGAFATLATLYSDKNGEFTEIKLNDGLASLTLRNQYSLYQVDTPDASFKAYGPAKLRCGVSKGVEIADRGGHCEVDGSKGQVTLNPNQYLYLNDPNAEMRVASAPHPDAWDNYSSQRDEYWDHRSPNEPKDIALVSGNLDEYGDWNRDPKYGNVWYPHVSRADWRPYSEGHWTWVSPYGWTWVGDESWGWAPYHYGTWVHESRGWGWCPGPENQCWSPAVVQYTGYGDNVAWCPLDPEEVHYPSSGLDIGLSFGNWSLFFSIGRSGCYYPSGPGYCEARPWSNVYANQATFIYNPTQINNYYGGYNGGSQWRAGGGFVSRNARYATYTTNQGFLNGGGYRPLPAARAGVFRTGRSFGGAPTGSQISGPPNLRPSRIAYAPSRHSSSLRPDPSVASRGVYRSAVPSTVARQSVGMGRVFTPRTRGAAVARTGGAPAGRPGAAGVTRLAGRPGAAGVTRLTGRPAAGAPGRMQRFNGISKSPFTRGAAAHNGGSFAARTAGAHAANAARANRSAAAGRAAVTRQAAGTRAANVARANRTRATAGRAAVARQASGAHRANVARTAATHRATARVARRANVTRRAAISHRVTQRAAAVRRSAAVSHRAARVAAVRRAPARAASHAAPRRSFARSAPRPSFHAAPRPAFHAAPRPSFHQSAPRPSAPRPSAPRGGRDDHRHGG